MQTMLSDQLVRQIHAHATHSNVHTLAFPRYTLSLFKTKVSHAITKFYAPAGYRALCRISSCEENAIKVGEMGGSETMVRGMVRQQIDPQTQALRPCASSLATSSFGRTRSKPCTIL
eukprot:764810-Hanusia_phi.AAC.1